MNVVFISGPHDSVEEKELFRLAMEMGATMIGIHAVISCKDKYYKIEDYHGIKVEYYTYNKKR